VVGGIGSIPGAMLGGVLLGFLGELVKSTSYSGMKDAIVFVLLVVVLLVKPAGLLGSAKVEKV
jgi:branched-chain amino acid transport system permease protein